jgi:hypothetical protein
MRVVSHKPPRPRSSVIPAVALAVVFESFLVLVMQDKELMAVTPWQDDPFHAWLSLVVFAVPMLLTVIGLRRAAVRLPWSRSTPTARQRDLVKAGLVLTAFVAATAADCWLSVALGQHRAIWDVRTAWLLSALAVLTVAAMVVTGLGLRDLRGRPREQEADWVADVLPARMAAWVRRHDRTVFLAASLLAAVAIIGALAYGERWTDPLLISWALSVEVTCYYSFCVLTNAVLGFIDRPARDRRTEHAVVVGSLAFQAAVAMHGQLEPLVGFGSPDGVGRLVQVTVVPALLVFVAALVLPRLLSDLRPASPARPAR